MDGQLFDRLARAFVSLSSRRGVLGRIARCGFGGLAGLVVAGDAAAACLSPKVKCGRKCCSNAFCCVEEDLAGGTYPNKQSCCS